MNRTKKYLMSTIILLSSSLYASDKKIDSIEELTKTVDVTVPTEQKTKTQAKDIVNKSKKSLQTKYGSASFYGPGFHGRKTASGEVFNQNALTAAHRTLPFGTKLRVTCTATGRSVVVKVNDRGPFAGRNRVLDLSVGAAKAIGMIEKGVTNVKYEVLN